MNRPEYYKRTVENAEKAHNKTTNNNPKKPTKTITTTTTNHNRTAVQPQQNSTEIVTEYQNQRAVTPLCTREQVSNSITPGHYLNQDRHKAKQVPSGTSIGLNNRNNNVSIVTLDKHACSN